MTPEDNTKLKDVEFYASTVNAWFNTRLEHDKSLLTLSTGAIGLLVTVLTNPAASVELLVLYLFAIFSFVVSLTSVLVIFKNNSTYLEKILSNSALSSVQLLKNLDSIAIIAFGVGILLTAIIGGVTAINSYKGANMSNESKNTTNQVQINESFLGATKLQPNTVVTKSFAGAAALQPQQPAQTTTAQSAQTTNAPPANNSQK